MLEELQEMRIELDVETHEIQIVQKKTRLKEQLIQLRHKKPMQQQE